MNKARGLSIIAITLLILQMFSVNFGMGTISKAANNDPETKVEVKSKSVDDDTLTWEVAVSALSDEEATAKTKLTFSSGQSHKAIDYKGEITADKTKDGYVIETPTDGTTYKVEVTTNVTDESQAKLSLSAETESEGNTYNDEAQVEVEREMKEGPESKGNEVVKEQNSSSDKGENEEGSSTTNTNEGQKEVQPLNEETKTEEEIGVPHPPFARTAKPFAIPGVKSGDLWPAPGSLKLEKDATETGRFAEWEVELKVQGKNLKTSSDIVLVFDRSNSMYGSRAMKAKAAAKQFVNSLLVQDSTVRIALVPFGSDTGSANDPHTDFQDYNSKNVLLNAIDAIQIYSTHQSGGTNIHAGLHAAHVYLKDSTADQKTIVLLSDGAPTYSMKANGYEKPYSWPGNRFDYLLKDFDYNSRMGNGAANNNPSYNLGPYSCGSWWWPQTCYEVEVRSHVIPTISEAKKIMNAGIDLYSIGLEVGNVSDAIYTLQNSQNKGYYQGGSDDLSPIFDEIAASLAYAATSAVVTDPLGEMFDLVKDGSYNNENFESSHGTVLWDDASETFTWDIGNVKEDEVYTLKYKVTLDCSKDPKAGTKYPTNKTTTLNYKDHSGSNASKNFPIPEVKVNSGKITKIGYRVNADKEPIDENGNVVTDKADAKEFYSELFGKDLDISVTHEIFAGDTPDGYQLHVGEDPTHFNFSTNGIVCETVWFGYVDQSELKAGNVTAEYLNENGEEIASSETHTGNIGDSYTTVQKDIDGYEFKEMGAGSADTSGTFTADEQTVIYIYTQLEGSITINKVDEENQPLEGAEFTLTGPNGYTETKTSLSDGKITFDELVWGTYTLKEVQAPANYRLLNKTFEIEINDGNLAAELTIENTLQGWEIPKTGGIGSLGFLGAGFMLMAGAGWFVYRRRYV